MGLNQLSKEKRLDIIQYTLIAILLIGICIIMYRNNIYIDNIQKELDEKYRYEKIYYDHSLQELKKQNKELYDSIAHIKNLDYAVQFKYKHIYHIDTVYIENKDSIKNTTQILPFIYENTNKNDSINYKLTIGAEKEPKWYTLDIDVGEEFLLYNKNNKGINQGFIDSKYNGNISDVTFFKNKKRFKDRFVYGPHIGCGYDVLNNNISLTIGFGITFDITK